VAGAEQEKLRAQKLQGHAVWYLAPSPIPFFLPSLGTGSMAGALGDNLFVVIEDGGGEIIGAARRVEIGSVLLEMRCWPCWALPRPHHLLPGCPSKMVPYLWKGRRRLGVSVFRTLLEQCSVKAELQGWNQTEGLVSFFLLNIFSKPTYCPFLSLGETNFGKRENKVFLCCSAVALILS
jgi:hypothetical protein